MKRLLRGCLILLVLLLLILLVGPFLIPVPPLKGTVPPEQLADPDSRFVEVNGLQVHYKIQGQGNPALVLLHGFASSTYTWREVLSPLGDLGTVVAYDRPAFGPTQRPMPGEWQGDNPYTLEAQADQTIALMDSLGIEKAVLVGNSAGGTVAMLAALRHPFASLEGRPDRVQALVLVDAAIYGGGGTPAWVRPLLHTPQAQHLGPLLARSVRSLRFARGQAFGERLGRTAWHDPSRLTPEIWQGYEKPLRAENWDRALWELTLASHPLGLDKRLSEVRMPVLVITGDDDRIVPTAQSIRLAGELPDAELVVIPNCGHVPHEECPQAWLEATTAFLAALP